MNVGGSRRVELAKQCSFAKDWERCWMFHVLAITTWIQHEDIREKKIALEVLINWTLLVRWV